MIALDTNILVYAVAAEDGMGRHILAQELLDKLGPLRPILPLQVVGEYLNVCRRRENIAFADGLERIEAIMSVHRCEPSIAFDFVKAAAISVNRKLAYFDALIITVAARAGATMLLSEDMHDGLVIEGLKIINPFAPANEALLAEYFASVA